MKGMILAAGYGTRLRPVTYTVPKPMVPLCNQPLIGWAAQSLIAADVRDLIVNLHHLPESIEQYLPERFPEAKFSFSFEQEILGTGGGVRKARPLLDGEEDFFLVNGDTVAFPRYQELRAARQRVNALAALTLRHPPQGDYFTPVWLDKGRITGFGQGRGEPLMFSGSHSISARVFDRLPDTDFSSIVDEVYRPVIEDQSETIGGIVDDGVWFDIGTPQRYMSASNSLRDLMVGGAIRTAPGSRVAGDSIVAESARASANRSVVGARSVVEGKVRDSVIWDDCRIAPGVELESCVVAHGVEIASGTYTRSMICADDRTIPRNSDYRFENNLAIVSI